MWLKVGGFALVAGLLGLLIWLYGGSKYKTGRADERTEWQAVVAKAEREKLAAYQQGVASVMGADARYIETVRTQIVPVTKTIIERSTAYAATPEGAAVCLPADRVSLLDATRGTLFPAPAAPAPDRTP
jgi:hypothetical protein